MRHYLVYSSSAHFLLLAVVFAFARNSMTAPKREAYYIDFIGPSRVVTMEKAGAGPEQEEAPAKAAAKAAKARPKAPERQDDDLFSAKPSDAPLPKPSVLNGTASLFKPQTASKAAAGQGGAPVLSGFSNFPYPWYITQVREALWNAWMQKMPAGGPLKCTVKFEISRNGAVKDTGIERSSGNRLFDNAAETSVESAGPFPRLPDDFYEDVLTVHVEFKAMEGQ